MATHRDTALNNAAETIGSALGRFAAEITSLTSWLSADDRKRLTKTMTEVMERTRADAAGRLPADGRIAAMAEIAHVEPPVPQKKRTPAPRRKAATASSSRGAATSRKMAAGRGR